MINRKPESKVYWKQASNGLIAHVYEHIASSFITGYMTNKNMYYVADFDHWARTYGTLCYLDFRLQSNESASQLHKAYAAFAKEDITFDMARHAALQISAEYQRPLMQFDDKFVNELRYLHSKAWQDIRDFSIEQATEDTSVNTVFSMEGIRYGRVMQSSFENIILHFEINKEVYKNNPALKALAILIIQTVALNLHRSLEDEKEYYDTGDIWDNGAEIVAYRTKLAFPKRSMIDQKILQERSNSYLIGLNKSLLSKKLCRLIMLNYKNESSRYFSYESMNEITNGIFIGYAGWKKAATISNIQLLMDNVSIEVINN